MSALPRLRSELSNIGYRAIESNFVFADVFAREPLARSVQLAAFTHSPPSYRNAALAAVEVAPGEPSQIAAEYRALGAPLLFVIEGQQVTIWEVGTATRPTKHGETTVDQLGALFAQNRQLWSPTRIHAARSFGQLDSSYQLSFVDMGLLPLIEGEIHKRLDHLLTETLAEVVRQRAPNVSERMDGRFIFRTMFRLLAAKVLQDRGHELSHEWNAADVDSVLRAIRGRYQLPFLPAESRLLKGTVFDAAWQRLCAGISFRNISSDDLAFVYENTLVTDQAREDFGTHSTPRAVAEYVVGRLNLQPNRIAQTSIYEPFAGAGIFMVAALSRMRDFLPVDMPDQERHNFLVQHIYGDEAEDFAIEVAMLSLILADYPNQNGWGVSKVDLFRDDVLTERAKGASIVLCNPPFGKFESIDSARYRKMAATSPSKQIAALEAVLDAGPNAIGFVLPEPFINGRHYSGQRERIERLYKDIEIVSLPDRVFNASVIRSSVVIAQNPRVRDETTTAIQSTTIKTHDRDRFLSSGAISDSRSKIRSLNEGTGELWIDELEELWDALSSSPRLGTIVDIHRGIEWEGSQAEAARNRPENGFRPGILSAHAVHAFSLDAPRYLDCRPEHLRKKAKAIRLPWGEPKILANAAMGSRAPWCFAAAVDCTGLIGSQQLYGIWPKAAKSGVSLEGICAILNSPVASAYVFTHSLPDRIRKGTLESLPLPSGLSADVDELVKQYTEMLREHSKSILADNSGPLADLLNQIDATILKAYDLAPRTERRLLEYFRGHKRRTVHPWSHWFPLGFRASLPLHRYISDEAKLAASEWVLKVFKTLPVEEANALRDYLE